MSNGDASSASGAGFNLMTNSSKFALRADGGSYTFYSNATSYTDDWYHLVVTRTDGLIEMYVDTVKQDQSTTYSGDLTENDVLHIGTDGLASRQYTQPIDEPRIYNRALTEAEVLQNYNAGLNKHRND